MLSAGDGWQVYDSAALSYASGNADYANIGGNFTKRDGDNDTNLSNDKVILGTADNSGSDERPFLC